jgi:hypothetical protein
MSHADEVAQKLDRLLVFLSLSGGAALVSKRARAVIASHGAVDAKRAVSCLELTLDDASSIVHVQGGLVADVRQDYRIFVSLEVCPVPDPGMLQRLRHARELIERVLAPVSPGLPPPGTPGAPPSGSPAHAVLFAPARRS